MADVFLCSILHTKLYFQFLFGNILFSAKECPLLEVFLRYILSLLIFLKLLKTLFQIAIAAWQSSPRLLRVRQASYYAPRFYGQYLKGQSRSSMSLMPKFWGHDSGSPRSGSVSGSWNHLESLFTRLSGASRGRRGSNNVWPRHFQVASPCHLAPWQHGTPEWVGFSHGAWAPSLSVPSSKTQVAFPYRT